MKIENLIEILKTKDQKKEVEFIIADKKGMMVAMDVTTKSKEMVKLLKMMN